jgi:hypothetical protein
MWARSLRREGRELPSVPGNRSRSRSGEAGGSNPTMKEVAPAGAKEHNVSEGWRGVPIGAMVKSAHRSGDGS